MSRVEPARSPRAHRDGGPWSARGSRRSRPKPRRPMCAGCPRCTIRAALSAARIEWHGRAPSLASQDMIDVAIGAIRILRRRPSRRSNNGALLRCYDKQSCRGGHSAPRKLNGTRASVSDLVVGEIHEELMTNCLCAGCSGDYRARGVGLRICLGLRRWAISTGTAACRERVKASKKSVGRVRKASTEVPGDIERSTT